MGFLLLEGGAEFNGGMSKPDLRAIELAGGSDAAITILPTAAAPDNNHECAGRNGVRWFQSLGARRVEIVPVIDQSSADDAELAAKLGAARLIYLLGGFPRYLGETLQNSRAWKAVLEAYESGAVIGGSSAGAMVLCEHYYDPRQKTILPGLDLLHNSCVLPHHNNFGKGWSVALRRQLPGAVLIGIDEQTGMLNEHPGKWSVYGAGKITLYESDDRRIFGRDEIFDLATD